jgi:hypothetical protein
MIFGLLSWLISSIFILLLTCFLFRIFRTGSTGLDFAVFIFLSIFLTTLYMLLAGLIGLLAPLPLLVLSLIGLLVLLTIPGLRVVSLGFITDSRSFLRQLKAWWRTLPRWLQWFSALAIALSAVRFAVLIFTFPPFVWDALTYHLTNVAEWTQRARITLFDTSMTRIYTPANYETFTLWFTVFLHHDVVVEAAGLPAYVLAAASVYAIGRGIGISPASSWFGALTYASMPALLLATTGTKNDPHMAAYYLLLMALLVNLVRRNSRHGEPRSLGAILLLLVVLLYAFGTKAYIIHIAPGFLLLGLLRQDGHFGYKRWWGALIEAFQEAKRSTKPQILVLSCILIAAVFLGGYWNIRNWVLKGNPFYPYGVQIESQMVLSGAEREAELSFDRFLENSRDLLFEKFGDKHARIVPDLDSTTGWGWFVYGLGIAALFLAVFRSGPVRILALSFLVSLAVIFFSIRPSPWNMRYVIWFPAIFSLAFAWVMENLDQQQKIPFGGIRVLAILAMALNFTAMLNYGRIPPDRFQAMYDLPLLERDAASLRLNMPGEYENTLKIVPRDAVLGYNVHSNGFIYPLYRADLSQRLVYIPISTTGTCYDVAQAMRERGTRYLFVAPEHTSDDVIGFLNMCGETETALRERSRNLYVLKDK